jgi:hypothetical protein
VITCARCREQTLRYRLVPRVDLPTSTELVCEACAGAEVAPPSFAIERLEQALRKLKGGP